MGGNSGGGGIYSLFSSLINISYKVCNILSPVCLDNFDPNVLYFDLPTVFYFGNSVSPQPPPVHP